MKIDNFKKQFLDNIQVAMAGQGRVLMKGEIIIIDEFVKQIKANNLELKEVN